MGFSIGKSLGGIVGAIGGALLGGPEGAAAGYTFGNSLFGNSEAKDNYKYQLQKQTEYNIGLWNMQNAYNTPKAQMERFKEAGLNPNLIYGQTNTASPISSASANFSLDNTQSQKTLGNYLALSNLGIQKDLSSAQVRNIDNSIDISKQNVKLARDRLKLDRDRLALDEDMANAGMLGQWIGRRNAGELNSYIGDLVTDYLKEKGVF